MAKNDSDAILDSPAFQRRGSACFRAERCVLGYLERHEDLLRRAQLGAPLLVGFSHGLDSTLLLVCLARLLRRKQLPPPEALHLDHGMRQGSREDAEAARGFAARISVPFHSERQTGLRTEAEAREGRYRYFERLCKERAAAAVFVAHHRDDDIETILFRLLRGTGPLGLQGIPERRRLSPDESTPLCRPFLPLERRTLEAAQEELALPVRVDPSNLDPTHCRRNQIRLELLPALRKKDPEDLRLRRLKHEAAALASAVAGELATVPPPAPTGGHCRVSIETLASLSPWAAERHLSHALQLLEQELPTRKQLRRVLALCLPGRPSGKRFEARGRWTATRLGSVLELTTAAAQG